MQTTTKLQLWELRAEFALRLATLYGDEVPAYNTLVDVSREVNEEFIRRNGEDAERLGSIQRVTAERHGAIRVGSARELAQVARVFAAFGMYPVGFYDLRDASTSSVPVVSTAFRPVDPDELARNPFRVFTSMLAHDDRRFFDEETEKQLEAFIGARTLFSEELLSLADKASTEKELEREEAARLLDLATAAFELSQEPVDHDWYFKLERISAVAADIGGVPSTHINHLTPRVLDIDDLYSRMQARGIAMIDEIQGPPNWEGPDVLLRQTSFRALAEERSFRHADGEVRRGSLRVRFGEVEQRGIALTEHGRDIYDRMVAEVDSRLAAAPAGTTRVDIAEQVWRKHLPKTEQELALQGLAYFTFRISGSGKAPRQGAASLRELVEAGVLVPEPIVYEDFLPRSAAGIFQSNLTDEGSRDDEQLGTHYDIDRLSEVLGTRIFDPNELYTAQQNASIEAAAQQLSITITHRPSLYLPPRLPRKAIMTTLTSTIPATAEITKEVRKSLQAIGVDPAFLDGTRETRTPITGEVILHTRVHSGEDIDAAITEAAEAFKTWRNVPAPVRGALVKRWGELLTEHKEDVATLITAEVGKIRSEALGEVQEMIDIADLAVGQSRQLYGKTMPSERPGHRLAETWHPLGVVGIISAFNFPVAVYAWNTALALVAGDTVVWKPADATRLSALAVDTLLARAVKDVGAPVGIHHLLLTDRVGGQKLVEDPRVALVSATGSVRMGQEIAPVVAKRFGRVLLELGGNNGAIVAPSADLDLALRGIVFAAAGTAGQRCTSLRRLIVHSSIADALVSRIVEAYRTLNIGSPTREETLVGPLINASSFQAQQDALIQAVAEGGEVIHGGNRVLAEDQPGAYYVEPAVVRMPAQTAVVHDETFAPILYVMTYETLEEAIEIHNSVPQGLSSAIFTQDQTEAERFLSASGSDCGIANVNIGTSGAEIGGAFGGEKETGGGRESGSDSWKVYMRQATNTINYSGELPLAQGVKFL